ncbi:hypothetical protein [Neisseria sp. 83E34]|uniref:hypothetical protein n=1 Tax=Neisseria sp. 83E34 TaxID=1692264 RepID=UPI0006CE8A5F|nr:hypothetical protein [Neisseria sp. 83E34]KPN72619.1 hypothetical protein AKG09_01960 [Neisseria sp. 83E34]
MSEIVEWEDRQKSIAQIIEELKTFENQELVVVVTDDEGETFKTVKLVSKGFDGNKVYCALHI